MFPLFTAHKNYLIACRNGLHVNVRLGSPLREDCHGMGICKMQPVITQPLDNCGCWIRAFARLDEPTGRLLLHFSNELIGERIRFRHFLHDSFTVERAFRIPDPVAKALGLGDTTYRIAPGHYPTLDDGEFTTLSLRIVESKLITLPALRAAA